MGWIKKIEDDHVCDLPHPDSAEPGSKYQCDNLNCAEIYTIKYSRPIAGNKWFNSEDEWVDQSGRRVP